MAHDDHFGHDHLHDVDGYGGDDFDYEDIDIKEALGLPDELPPIRLLPLPELAAMARSAPLLRQLAALAAWVGKDGREVDEDGDLTDDGLADAQAALGADAEDLSFLWEYALGVEWLVFDDEDADRVLPGETAQEWAGDADETVFDAWSSTLAAVLGETLELYGPELPEEDGDDAAAQEPEFDFTGQGMAIAILLFLARREGLTVDEFAEVLWENAAGGHDEGDEDAHEEIAQAREEWESQYGDAAGMLLDKLTATDAITEEDGLVQLTPLALAALHEQLVEAGVDIPLLPPTAAELSGTQLLAMAAGVSDTEFDAEADAWIAAHGNDVAARDLLSVAAQAAPGERMLAVATVTRMGAPAEAAWRDSLGVPSVRGYAKVALAQLAGAGTGEAGELPPGLEMEPADVAWVATDLLVLAIDEDFPDPDDLAASFREAVPASAEPVIFEAMANSGHPDALLVLSHLGEFHPDKQIAKAARTAAHKVASRRG
jgi:hypothetical protein